MMKVSVIIPNYNHASYLKQRIDSVVNQTYQNLEVIILDDCSTDNSRDIIESFRNHPLIKHIVYNQSNTGSPFKQWKRGIDLTKGEWIWIAESDDYADPQFIEIMLTTFPNPQSFGLLYSDSHIVLNERVSKDTFALKRRAQLNSNHWDDDYTNNGIHEIENYLMPYGTINNTSAVLFRSDILKKVNPFDVAFRYMGDKYTFIKVLAISDIAYVNKPLNYYRAAVDSKPKHTQDYFDYVYEHFLIFNWIVKNISFLNRHKFLKALSLNLEVSLLAWNRKKVSGFVTFFSVNKKLFWKMLLLNLKRSFRKLVKS